MSDSYIEWATRIDVSYLCKEVSSRERIELGSSSDNDIKINYAAKMNPFGLIQINYDLTRIYFRKSFLHSGRTFLTRELHTYTHKTTIRNFENFPGPVIYMYTQTLGAWIYGAWRRCLWARKLRSPARLALIPSTVYSPVDIYTTPAVAVLGFSLPPQNRGYTHVRIIRPLYI